MDGSPVIRPVVPLVVAPGLPAVLGVIDSGSLVSVANADLFGWLGIDIEQAEPVYEMSLSVAGGFESTPVFEVELRLRAPSDGHAGSIPWRLELGARRRWRLPFAVLLGQRGWFDRLPTRIDATTSTIEI